MLLAFLLAAQLTTEGALLPCGLPFECINDLQVANAAATWRMMFDRRRPGVYDVIHWELRLADRQHAEYLANIVRTDGLMKYRFFVRERRGVWYTLGIRKRWVWREVRRGSEEQDMMVVRLARLLTVANALRQGAEPLSLRIW